MLAPWPRTKGSQARRLQQIQAPTVEPISFDLQKTVLKIGNVNASLFAIQAKIAAARQLIEHRINRRLVQQTYDLFLDDEAYVSTQPAFMPWWAVGQYAGETNFGMPEIVLPLPPVQQVLGVYTYDQYGNETLVDPSIYTVTRAQEPCRIRLNPSCVWPEHRGYEAFRVRFTCGYATSFTISQDGSGTIQVSNAGVVSGQYVRFTSLDGTLPDPLAWGQSYQVSNLVNNQNAVGFQVVDANGNLITPDNEWNGTGFLGEVPAPLIEAVVMVSGLNQSGEIPSRLPGTGSNSRLSPIILPTNPDELISAYVWPWL